MDGSASGPRTVVLVAAGVQAAAVVAVVWIGSVSEGLHLDPWRPLAIAALYLVPAGLAVLAVRARPSLLLAAAATSVVLAVVGFSLHSFVFLPVAVVYVVAHSGVEDRAKAGIAALLLCPLLALAGMAILFFHDDPACYARHASGEVTVDRTPDDVMSGSLSVAAGSDVVARGCTSDTVVGWEAASSVALSGLALAAGVGFTPPVPAGPRDQAPSGPRP